MKKARISTLLASTAVAGALGALAAPAYAQVAPAPGLSALTPAGPFLVRFDEDGHATIAVNGGPITTLVGSLLADPTTPNAVGGPLALSFMLPEPVISGDVSFSEPGGTGGSDWLRFTDAAGHISGVATGAGSRMLFYSDLELGETGSSMADQPFPRNLGTGLFLAQTEIGAEGNNGFDYRPGGVAYPANNEYIGISDAVPEPETYALLLAGFGLIGAMTRWRNRG
ncbi:MAG TPA: PEP-CTERM sorting domain-containing protein [Caldimonas sp.]|nr:PEP-CTERM sorting domain-containing protein [Caldimonas sp.]HEX4235543.1 PEP-CTERM sorting domain-containing protein [Caldimonas sp.]